MASGSGRDGRTVVYTDGACSGNPGPGGWGWVVPDGESGFGGDESTTNQRMELQAVIEAVRAIDGPMRVVSDSTYVVNCFRDRWWEGWLRRGWLNSQKKPVANRDLWEPLLDLYQQRDVEFEWVKGHSGDRWNDRADELAVMGRDSARPESAGPPSARPESADSQDYTTRRIAVVGHRPPELGGYDENPIGARVRARLGEILKAKAQMYERVVVNTGLGLGAETLGAEAALAAGADMVAVLAFPDPAARWPKASQERFDELVDQAIDVVVVDQKLPKSAAEAGKAFARRDQWLIENSDEAIVVFDGKHRGISAQVRSFEKSFGEDVWIVDPAMI